MKVHLGLLTLFILLQLTFATTINIPENYPTIQEGIDNSVTGDTVLVSEGTYYENLIIQNKDIAIITLSDNTTLDGGGSGPVVSYFDVSESALLEGFTLRNGKGHPSSFSGFLFGGGIYCGSSAPHLNQLNISGNTVFSGGGIAYYSTSPTELSPLITNCIIQNNLASESGGIYCTSGNLSMEYVQITHNNTDSHGGGVWLGNDC